MRGQTSTAHPGPSRREPDATRGASDIPDESTPAADTSPSRGNGGRHHPVGGGANITGDDYRLPLEMARAMECDPAGATIDGEVGSKGAEHTLAVVP